MTKRQKHPTKTASRTDRSRQRHSERPRDREAAAIAAKPADVLAHPPAGNLSLLAISIILFAGWFLFLLVTALVG